jgi:hypothetical protein
VTGFQFSLSCPVCGCPVDVVTTGRVVAGRETSAIVACPSCPVRRRTWQVQVSLLPLVYRDDRPGAGWCGTVQGYARHRRLGESPCDECKRARARSEQERLLTKGCP